MLSFPALDCLHFINVSTEKGGACTFRACLYIGCDRLRIEGMKLRKPYPTDLTDEQWELCKPMLPPDKPRGRKRSVDVREVINALLYRLGAGCAWRLLPHDFPAWQTVSAYCRLWREAGLFTQINT